jgi:hypothetical protein
MAAPTAPVTARFDFWVSWGAFGFGVAAVALAAAVHYLL